MVKTAISDFRSLSLFSRLTDNAPKNMTDGILSEQIKIDKFKESVQKNLLWLLNTRKRLNILPEYFRELRLSSLCYGVMDFSNYLMFSKEDQEKFCADLERSILLFENRLTNIYVSLESLSKLKKGTILINLEADLIIKNRYYPFLLQMIFSLKNGLFELKGEPYPYAR